MGFSPINHPFWGSSIYGNPHLQWLGALKPLCCGARIHPGLQVVGVSSEFQTQPVHIGHCFSRGCKANGTTKEWERNEWRKSRRRMRNGLPLCSMSLIYTKLSECPAYCSRQTAAGLAQLQAEENIFPHLLSSHLLLEVKSRPFGTLMKTEGQRNSSRHLTFIGRPSEWLCNELWQEPL